MQIPSFDRAPAVAGSFYPGSAPGLAKTVKDMLDAVQPDAIVENPLMIMAPHAGYIYSGRIAAECLCRVGLPQTLFLLGPNHTGKGQRLAVWPNGNWNTPLGSVPVDAEAAEMLIRSDAGYKADREAHERDHCLEVLLPFLQVKAPGIRIVPVSVAWPDLGALRRAGEVLAQAMDTLSGLGRGSSILVSSDMSHFLKQEDAKKVDSLALQHVLELDPEALFNTVLGRRISMCGVLPATLALFAAKLKGARHTRPVAYATSGDVSGDMGRVVGYSSLIVW